MAVLFFAVCSGTGDAEGLFSVGFIGNGARREQDHDVAVSVHSEVRSFVNGGIVRQRRVVRNGEVYYVGGLVHTVLHLHGDGLNDVALIVGAAELFQRGGGLFGGVGGRQGLGISGAAGGQHQEKSQQSGQRGEMFHHKVLLVSVLFYRRTAERKSLYWRENIRRSSRSGGIPSASGSWNG